ncbi:/ / hypothetical protein / 578753:580873 Forward [Candidatus Hepatoplasma crinochetorum]|uniref:Uncharacterized protein n=1 Tax=Candidatus Hepatoplasma crinochetorum TaxID=295596 RepID=A0A0G7ZNF1_9MOLU|nr:/ / hypothetical protein / 578753:580873 Forward [Candidatus Hepatoplasma crinochetorum]
MNTEEKYIFEKFKEIDLKNLKLLSINPRFTDFGNKSENFSIENIYYESFNKETEIETFNKIFSSEENLESSYELFESLIDNGYDKYIDRIWIIKTKYNNNYVLEGNRRILFLKIIFNVNNLRNFFFENEEKISYDICKNFSNLEEKNKCKNKKKKFFKKIKNKIEENNFDKKNILLSTRIFFEKCNNDLNLIENECFNFEKTKNKILKNLRNKHMVPNIKGKKDWNRLLVLKTYLEIFKIYNNKYANYEEIIREISKDYQIAFKKVNQDLRSSFWIDKLLNNLDNEKREKILLNKNYKISAIEISPSTLKIKNKENKIETLQKKIKLKFISINNIEIKNTNWNNLANFLFDNFENGNFTTRGWKNENENYKLLNFFGIEEYSLKKSYLKYKEKRKNNEKIEDDLKKEATLYKQIEENKKKINPQNNKYIYKIEIKNDIYNYIDELKNIHYALQNLKKVINWITTYELTWILIPKDEFILSNSKNEEILYEIIGSFAGLRIIFDYLNLFIIKRNGLLDKNIKNEILKVINFMKLKYKFLDKVKKSNSDFEKWQENILDEIDKFNKEKYINITLNEEEIEKEIFSWLTIEERIKINFRLSINQDILFKENINLKENYDKLTKTWNKINEINFENEIIKDNDWNKKPLRNYILHNFLPILERIKNIDNREYFQKIIELVSRFLDELRVIIDFIEDDINFKISERIEKNNNLYKNKQKQKNDNLD